MHSKKTTDPHPLTTLRRTALALGAFSAIFLFLTYRSLAHFWGSGPASRWLVLSLGLMLILMWIFWHNLPQNFRKGERYILPSLGTGNALTFLRGTLVAATAGFILLPLPPAWLAWVPALFFTIASLGDFFDGYLARRQDRATHLGEILDLYVDGIGVLAASFLLIQYGKVPVWYLLVGLARYLFLGGIWLRRRLRLPVYDLPPSEIRRTLAAVQMVLIFVLLWPVFSPPLTAFVAAVFAIPFLANFARDWLLVSGKIKSGTLHLASFRGWFIGWFPLILRMAVFILILASAPGRFFTLLAQAEHAAIFGLPAPGVAFALLVLLEFTLSVLLVIGFAGRTVALAGMILIAVGSNFIPLTFTQSALVVLYAVLFHLGTGVFSLWRPEDRLVGLRAGRHPRPKPAGILETPQGSRVKTQSPLGEAS